MGRAFAREPVCLGRLRRDGAAPRLPPANKPPARRAITTRAAVTRRRAFLALRTKSKDGSNRRIDGRSNTLVGLWVG